MTEEMRENKKTTDEEILEALSFDNKQKTTEDVNEDSGELLIPINDENSEDEITIIENEDKDEENSNNEINDIEEKVVTQKKASKLYKILIIIISILVTILTLGILMYFMGFFEPEPIEKPMLKKEKKTKKILFDEKRINKSKLNKKLKHLTKTELMSKDELEKNERKLRKEEEKEKEKLKAQYEDIKQKKELLKKEKISIEKKRQELLKLQEETKRSIKTKETSNSFMSFINIATIKGELYKSYLDKILAIDNNVLLCRDLKNRIVIYTGPYDSEKQRNEIFNKFLKKDFKESYLVDFTKEEYEKMCKY